MAEAEATVYGPITDEIVARFLRCELEAYLETRKVIGSDREFADWRRQSRDRFKQAALVVLRSRYSDDEIHVGMPAAAALKQRRWRLIIDGIVETPMLRACVDAVELARSPKNGSPPITDRSGLHPLTKWENQTSSCWPSTRLPSHASRGWCRPLAELSTDIGTQEPRFPSPSRSARSDRRSPRLPLYEPELRHHRRC